MKPTTSSGCNASTTRPPRLPAIWAPRCIRRRPRRQRYLSEVVNYVEPDSTWHEMAGFEFWFLPLAVRTLGLAESGTDAYLAISG